MGCNGSKEEYGLVSVPPAPAPAPVPAPCPESNAQAPRRRRSSTRRRRSIRPTAGVVADDAECEIPYAAVAHDVPGQTLPPPVDPSKNCFLTRRASLTSSLNGSSQSDSPVAASLQSVTVVLERGEVSLTQVPEEWGNRHNRPEYGLTTADMVVSKVAHYGPAEKAGVKVGMKFVSVGGKDVSSDCDVHTALRSAEGPVSITLQNPDQETERAIRRKTSRLNSLIKGLQRLESLERGALLG